MTTPAIPAEEREINLLLALRNTAEGLTAAEIIKRVSGYNPAGGGSARRMFERDKDILRQIGVPLRASGTGDQCRYRIEEEDYALAPLRLDAAQTAALDLAASGPDAQVDAEARLGRVRAFAAERLREHAAPTVLSVTGSARDAIIEEIRAYASAPVAGAEAPRLTRGQVLVAHVEHGPDGLVVAALETHGVTTKNPAAHTRRGNKRH